ncbi:MAG: hypothetical protein ACYDH4_09580 [Candidatus Cryosericum sp.]
MVKRVQKLVLNVCQLEDVTLTAFKGNAMLVNEEDLQGLLEAVDRMTGIVLKPSARREPSLYEAVTKVLDARRKL